MVILSKVFSDVALKSLKNEIDQYHVNNTEKRKHKIVYCPDRGQFGVQINDENLNNGKKSFVIFISDNCNDYLCQTSVLCITVLETNMYLIIENESIQITIE